MAKPKINPKKGKEGAIRQRASYKRWLALYEVFNNESMAVSLKAVHNLIDSLYGYKTQGASNYSEESLGQVIKDLGID